MRFVVFLRDIYLVGPISLDLYVVEALCFSGIAMVSLSQSSLCQQRVQHKYVSRYLLGFLAISYLFAVEICNNRFISLPLCIRGPLSSLQLMDVE
jgi:hypothetical protein